MLFSSTVFIFYFLPIVFLVTRFVKNIKITNIFLLLASLLFYAWGEPKYILLMLVSIALNYVFGLLIAAKPRQKVLFLVLCVACNLGLLGYFKYFDFFIGTINAIAGSTVFELKNIMLPIGISFYTFQAMSYVIDVYRHEVKAQKNPLYLALYISFFPQLIAGPIVKYHDIENQLLNRKITRAQTAEGIKYFIIGLSKKVILANTFAVVVDLMFSRDLTQFGTLVSWAVMILYTLQIYFDFSGYSDMAIGLGKMFGFEFLPNFNMPYIASSIKDFWRRWHISLSTWFREYLYIPLGGNRKGAGRTYVNLLIVFLCTGFWHGASFNFVIWGLWHGAFIVLERLWLHKYLDKPNAKYLGWLYTIVVVVVGWVFFRAENLASAAAIIKNMFVPTAGVYNLWEVIDPKVLIFTVVGIFLSGWHAVLIKKQNGIGSAKISVPWLIILALLLAYCIILLVSNTYNPFIYFRF